MPACCAMSRAARTAFSMVLSVPPSSWMPNEDDRLARHLLDILAQRRMRDRLTTEADDDDAVDIRVAGKARQHLLAHRRIGRHIEQPVLKTMLTAPRTWLATMRQHSLPQAHVGRIRTWLRMPGRPSTRR